MNCHDYAIYIDHRHSWGCFTCLENEKLKSLFCLSYEEAVAWDKANNDNLSELHRGNPKWQNKNSSA